MLVGAGGRQERGENAGLVALGTRRKQAEPGIRNMPVCSALPWPLLQLCPQVCALLEFTPNFSQRWDCDLRIVR